MATATIFISPADQGTRMRLADFEQAQAAPGHLYELAQGVITVVEVPGRRHLALVMALRRQLSAFDTQQPGVIHTYASGSECKIVLAELESERHPDLAIYRTMPPAADIWASWIPEIVVEVVSPSSERRDYVDKRQEYLLFGVREYWIVDADKQSVLVLRRSGGRWKEQVLSPQQVYRTQLLPGFELSCAELFAAISL